MQCLPLFAQTSAPYKTSPKRGADNQRSCPRVNPFLPRKHRPPERNGHRRDMRAATRSIMSSPRRRPISSPHPYRKPCKGWPPALPLPRQQWRPRWFACAAAGTAASFSYTSPPFCSRRPRRPRSPTPRRPTLHGGSCFPFGRATATSPTTSSSTSTWTSPSPTSACAARTSRSRPGAAPCTPTPRTSPAAG
jgi:hypothetical protein